MPVGALVVPTMAVINWWPAIEPRKGASLRTKMPPSAPASQWPTASSSDLPTTGPANLVRAIDLRNSASPKENPPPSDATGQLARVDQLSGPDFDEAINADLDRGPPGAVPLPIAMATNAIIGTARMN